MLNAAICKSMRTIHIRITITIITVRSLYRGDTFQYHGLSSVTISANMLLVLISILFLSYITESVEETSYAKVSRNGQLARDSDDLPSWTIKTLTRNDTHADNTENRSIKDIAITWSPVYVSPSIPRLKKGEAADYPLTPRYSTLNREIIAKLDATTRKKQIQQRFHPPAVFDHSVRDTTPIKAQNGASMNLKSSSKVNSSSNFLGPIFPNAYNYNPSEFLNDKPIISFEEYSPLSTDNKIPIKPLQNKPSNIKEHEADYPNFDTASLYDNDEHTHIRKPTEFINHHDHTFSSHMEAPYEHDSDIHHDVIYDHVPDYEEHHKDQTTKEPEMNDQRLDKRPYSYYFIGKKLWYIPLYFSIYFIIYIAALVLKSIARHKISLPAHLAETVNHSK